MLARSRGSLGAILFLVVLILITAPYWFDRHQVPSFRRPYTEPESPYPPTKIEPLYETAHEQQTRPAASPPTVPALSTLSGSRDDYTDVGRFEDGDQQPYVQRKVYDQVDHSANYVPAGDYNILYSVGTSDKKYFTIDFSGAEAYNPNIIPHPQDKAKWIVVAQDSGYRDDIGTSEQIVCIAEFKDSVLHCPKYPTALAISPSIDGQCGEEWGYVNMRRGPRDARVFYGPEYPYIIYGSQSYKTCLGLWVQNLWMLLDHAKHPPESFARGLTEIRRPLPWRQIEKNYFLFWDANNTVHAHYDIWPNRAFAQLKYDGGVVATYGAPDGLDLAPQAAKHDEQCMKKFPPFTDGKEQGIHQGTNSLMVTMCKRADPTCKPTDENTFIMHMIQRKTFDLNHAIYEPFPILFHRRSPFELYAVAQKPLYFHGIELLTEKTGSRNVEMFDLKVPNGHTEMVYTTSISWKEHSQTYHGYIDDVMFIGFGIEDTKSAGIDVLVSDVLRDISLCT